MPGIVEDVRKKVSEGCLAETCKRGRCRLYLKNVPEPYLIIDFDEKESPSSPAKGRCDYLLVADDSGNGHWVVPLEFKDGRVDASRAIRQLRDGACVADRLVPTKKSVAFRPVLVYRSIHPRERDKLRKKENRVRFRGKNQPIRSIKCGGTLPAELNSQK